MRRVTAESEMTREPDAAALRQLAAVVDAACRFAQHCREPARAEDGSAVFPILEIARGTEHFQPQLERITAERHRHLVHETLRGERGERMQRRAPPAARRRCTPKGR